MSVLPFSRKRSRRDRSGPERRDLIRRSWVSVRIERPDAADTATNIDRTEPRVRRAA